MRVLRLVQQGKAIRLKAPEGTFSYYHPNHLFTGFGWDAQSACLLLIKHTVRSILILGLGGGTVARQCRMLFPEAEIVGVEIDEWVLQMAFEYFDLGALDIVPVVMSGQTYLKKTRRRFDAIIDDMWLPKAQSPKPVLMEPGWVHLVSSRLRPEGMYAANLYSRQENPNEVKTAVQRLKSIFQVLLEIRPSLGQTTVIAGGFNLHTPREVRIKLRRLSASLVMELKPIRFHTVFNMV